MSQWYYTSNRQQMGPVSRAELQELGAKGILRPSDLVWEEGTADWVKAETVKGLIQAADSFKSSSKPSVKATREAKPGDLLDDLDDLPRKRRDDREEDEDDRPRRRTNPDREVDESPRRRREDDDDDRPRRSRRDDDESDDFDDEPRPRRRRRKKGSSKLWLILGGVVGGLILVVFLIMLIATLARETGSRSFRLADSQTTWWNVTFKAGHRVEIRVNSTGQSDIDLYVFDPAGGQVAFDDGDSKDCFVAFVPPVTQRYKVEVRNMHRIDQVQRNGFNSGTLTFTETPLNQVQAPNNPGQNNPRFEKKEEKKKVFVPPQPPNTPPGGAATTLAGNLTLNDPIDPRRPGSRHKLFTHQLNAGTTYTIDMMSQAFDSVLRIEDAGGNQLAADDDSGEGNNARIVFRPTQTGMYRIIATSFGGNSTGAFTIRISPP